MTAVFTELFRVALDRLASQGDPDVELNAETSIWLRGLGDAELVGLWELLPGAMSDGTLMGDLVSQPDADALLMTVPDNFLQCLCELPDADVAAVMKRWQQTEELADWSTQQLGESFSLLRQLAHDAASADEIVVQKVCF